MEVIAEETEDVGLQKATGGLIWKLMEGKRRFCDGLLNNGKFLVLYGRVKPKSVKKYADNTHGSRKWTNRFELIVRHLLITMSAMANVVERSEWIIRCMSDAYKQSAAWQWEANYDQWCKRNLIPLIARESYRPDGWLGLLMGSRMCVDFGRCDFDVGCHKMMTNILLQRNAKLPLTVTDSQEDCVIT